MNATSSAAAVPDPVVIPRHVKRIAIVVILGAIMSVLDTTIVNVALQSLSVDLHAPLDQVQWVVTGYLLAIAAVLPITGWAANRFGARRVYMTSIVLFTIGSLLCGFAWNIESLIFFRVLQGIGGGLVLPVGQIILVKAAGPRALPRLMSMIGVPIILAPVFGPTIGGLLIEHAGWEWIFFVNIPIGIVAVALGRRLLPADEPEHAGKLDVLGLALIATGLVGVTYGLAETGTTGTIASPHVLVPLLGGIALVATFLIRSLRIPEPLLDIRLFSNKAFAAAAFTTFCLGAALFGAMILMPLYFQTVRGQDAVHTGLLLMPQGVGAAFAMAMSGRVTERFGGGITALFGVIVTAVATLPFVFIGAETSYWLIGAAMIVRGFGIGMSMMPSMTAAFSVLRRDQVAHASPQLTVLQRVGGSIGTAIFTVVLQRGIDSSPQTPAGVASAFGATYWWVMAVAVAALVPVIILATVERRAKLAPAPEAVPAGAVPALGGLAMSAVPAADRLVVIDELRRSVGELLGAERRLRGRDRRGPHGLSFSEVRALIALGRTEDGTATAGAVAKAADLNPATVTALLDSLEERGIATRRRAEEDRRCVVVSLTDEGRKKLAEAQAKWQSRLDEALADLPDEEVLAAAGVLRRLAGVFDAV